MKLRRISLSNFRNFINEKLEFSTDPEKKFTIILGQNTYGKTTLVKSFIWCLYRINLFDDKNLLNSDVGDHMVPTDRKIAKVELELDHNGYSYRIITKEEYTKLNNGNIVVTGKASTSVIKIEGVNSVPVSPARVDEEIDSILRPELKEYFFFDGETNSIDSVSNKKNLTEAVTNILGLKRIETLRDIYGPGKETVTYNLRSELTVEDEDLLDSLNSQLETASNKKNECETDIKTIEKEISDLEVQKQNLTSILDGNKDVAEYQNRKRNLEKDINTRREKKEICFSNLIQMINGGNSLLKILFSESYMKFDFEKMMNESSFQSSNSYKGIREEAVDDLIKSGRCLCGAIIKDGNDAYKHLLEAKEHMEPKDYGKYISDFVSAESSNYYGSLSSLNNLTEKAGEIKDHIVAIDEESDELKGIISKIEGRPDVGEIQGELNNINYQLGIQNGALEHINKIDLPEIIEKINEINSKIVKASTKNSENEFIKKCLDYAQSIYDLTLKKISKSRTEIREKLENEVGKIFKSMYHGDREIVIDEQFRTKSIISAGSGDKSLDKSTGLGTVVNYSFVAGLMKLAKASILTDDEFGDPENSDEVYPLVMDAPFSNTDDTHIRNICQALPNYCDQIIMFVMEKDFNYASDSILNKIGKLYKLTKESETRASIEAMEVE